ncbi:MAG: hypothetical protein FJ086_04930 [Deltaproteobacteria bacterium]|nr:hypothetical protein [Deltaproteobacteria bacterium]
MKWIRTRHGARLVHGRSIVSSLPAQAGPTHSVFDLLAAATVLLTDARRVALLGFAAGGSLAPLRALGCSAAVRAADLEISGVEVFRDLASAWGGDVKVAKAEASAWLRRQRTPFDVVIDDLSVVVPGDVRKPEVSFTTIPSLAARKLRPGGVALLNLLPEPGMDVPALRAQVAAPFPDARAVWFEDWENEFVLGGERLPAPAALQRALDTALRRLGSPLAGGFRVSAVKQPP